MTEKEFTVPEYYSAFSCKCGACRYGCCAGWGITVSMQEYYRLLGLACGKHLRAKLDCALKIVSHPTPARYAQLGPGFRGNCPLQADSGLCALQTHMGEGALPSICRVYPRAYRTAYQNESAMSASCERVTELLFALEAPMRFEARALAPETLETAPARPDVSPEAYARVRELCTRTLQDRSIALPARVNRLCEALIAMDARAARDKAVYAGAWDAADGEADACADARAFAFAAGVTAALMAFSQSLSPFFLEAFQNMGLRANEGAARAAQSPEAARAYALARARFERLFPNWQILFEQVLVNHAFFTDFPYSDLRETFADESASLAATYLVLRFMCVSYMASRETLPDLVDVVAACFRVIEHTAFDYNACRAVIRLENENRIRLPGAILRA